MKWDYAAGIKSRPEILNAARNASVFFEKQFAELPMLTATWDYTRDEKDRSIITLTLKDGVTGIKQHTRYAEDEIKSPSGMRDRFNVCVGNILHPGA
jgi:hypothetical protein